jgi:hypothetical protein
MTRLVRNVRGQKMTKMAYHLALVVPVLTVRTVPGILTVDVTATLEMIMMSRATVGALLATGIVTGMADEEIGAHAIVKMTCESIVAVK